jgi:hypothetical protein
MDDDAIVMIEVQTEMMDLLARYPQYGQQAVAMCFKLILDCYVVMLGEEETAQLLEHATESVKLGNHTVNSDFLKKPPKTSIH